MKKVLWVFSLLFVLLVPMSAGAQTIAVSQTITITARVAPARSIVVNDQGQMIKIYSNTYDAITPRVYLGDVPGAEQPLTPELMSQYQSIIAGRQDLEGIAIPVQSDAKTVRSNVPTWLLRQAAVMMQRF